MRFLSVRVIFLTVINLIGCAGSGLKEFPTDYIYIAKPNLQKCSRHKIIKNDPVTVDKGEMIAWNQCPDVFGFHVDDAGKIMNWVRDAQKTAKERCQ